MLKDILLSTGLAFSGAGSATAKGLGVMKSNPQIMIYPFLAAIFIIVTFPLVNGLVYQLLHSLATDNLTTVADDAPDKVRELIGLVTFSVFYTIFVTAYFTTAVSAGVLSKLDGRPTTTLYGLRLVLKHFGEVTKFALLAIFFFPISAVAQRRKLPKGIIGVIGSSLSLNMSMLAPVILTEEKRLMPTIRKSVDTLGGAWKENLIIKVGMYLAIFVLVWVSFLPEYLEDVWFDSETAHLVGVLAGVMLTLVGYVLTKVIGSVFTATLYHQAASRKKPI